MRSSIRTTVTLFAAAVLLPVSALTASAAPVGNDTSDTAIATDLEVVYNQDTTEAATETLDAELNAYCGAPAVRGSVWYKYTATGAEDSGILVDGTGTDYDLGFMIFEGEPTADTMVSCGPMMSAAYTTAGNTYYIMAFTANATDTVGGNLVLTVTSPETPTISVTVDPRGTAFKDGSALITGTYTCEGQPEWAEIQGMLTQRVGRLKITGDVYLSDLECDGTDHTWEAWANSYNGYFAGGKAVNVTLGIVCGALACSDGYSESTIQLTRAKK